LRQRRWRAASNLTWTPCSVGQRLDGGNRIGPVAVFNWDGAQRTGDSPWRVPTGKELPGPGSRRVPPGRVQRAGCATGADPRV